MSPVSRKELVTLTECRVRIEHLENTITELKQELAELRKERKENQQRLSDRRLAIYLTLSSILGAAILKIIEWLLNLGS